jgi:hypothetical protein
MNYYSNPASPNYNSSYTFFNLYIAGNSSNFLSPLLSNGDTVGDFEVISTIQSIVNNSKQIVKIIGSNLNNSKQIVKLIDSSRIKMGLNNTTALVNANNHKLSHKKTKL